MPNPKTEKYGTDIVAYKASELWSTLPSRCKKLPSLDLFKCEIESWNCSDCPCNICWNFVDGVGFVNKIKGNRQEVYLSIDKYPGCIWELSGEYLLWESLS